jgi:hypothetical protein
MVLTATDPTSQGTTGNSAAAPPIPAPGCWNSVLNDWSRLDEVPEGGKDTIRTMFDMQMSALVFGSQESLV